MNSIKKTYQDILGDYPFENPTFIKCIIARLLNPGFSVLYNYRIGKYFYESKFKLFRVLSSRKRMKLIFKKNCDISFDATIGRKMTLPHPIGIVIGADSIIKDHVTLFQNVTIGSHGKKGKNFSYPVIENGVKIFAGAVIIGGVTIGENSTIGTNAVVNIDIPPNSIAVGIPCKIIKNAK